MMIPEKALCVCVLMGGCEAYARYTARGGVQVNDVTRSILVAMLAYATYATHEPIEIVGFGMGIDGTWYVGGNDGKVMLGGM